MALADSLSVEVERSPVDVGLLDNDVSVNVLVKSSKVEEELSTTEVCVLVLELPTIEVEVSSVDCGIVLADSDML